MQNEKPADLSFACFQGEAWRVCQLSIYRHRGLLSIILCPIRPPYESPRTDPVFSASLPVPCLILAEERPCNHACMTGINLPILVMSSHPQGVYMYIIAVVAEKGEVGKTTLALDLAVTASKKGRTVAVMDVDPQATASKWTDRRDNEHPWVVPTHSARLAATIEQANGQGVDFIVIDTPPHSATDAAEAARRADVVLTDERRVGTNTTPER